MERFQIKGAPTCRVVYPKGLFTKTLVKGAEDKPENYKYNAILLVPKDDAEKIAQVQAAYDEAFAELQAKGFGGKTAKGINPKQNCWEDGDEYADNNKNAEAFRGYMRLKVSSRQVRPIVTDMAKRSIFNGYPISGVEAERISDEELNDGDYIFAAVSFWTYAKGKGMEGIGANVHAIKRAAAGERIGGASNDVDDYLDTEDYE